MAGETTDARKRRLDGAERSVEVAINVDTSRIEIAFLRAHVKMLEYSLAMSDKREAAAKARVAELETDLEPKHVFVTDGTGAGPIYLIDLKSGKVTGTYTVKPTPPHACKPPRIVFFRYEWERWACPDCDQLWVLLREAGPGSKKVWNEYTSHPGGVVR